MQELSTAVGASTPTNDAQPTPLNMSESNDVQKETFELPPPPQQQQQLKTNENVVSQASPPIQVSSLSTSSRLIRKRPSPSPRLPSACPSADETTRSNESSSSIQATTQNTTTRQNSLRPTVSESSSSSSSSSSHEEQAQQPQHSHPSYFLTFASSPEIDEIGRLFQRGAYYALAIYGTLLVVVLRHVPIETWEQPHGTEQMAHIVSFLLLLVVNGSRLAPLIALRPIPDSDVDDDIEVSATETEAKNPPTTQASFLHRSGFWIGTLSVQVMALSANAWMGFYPSPVMIDPITGLRSHLVRWVEWTALAFLMTFLTNNIEAPFYNNRQSTKIDGAPSMRKSKTAVSYSSAICLGLSTSAGLMFPFVHNTMLWWIIMILSCLLFLPVYVLLNQRYHRYAALRQQRHRRHKTQPSSFASSSTQQASSSILQRPQPHAAHDEERYELARTSFVLSAVCAVAWTGLTIFYLAACLGHVLYVRGNRQPYHTNSIWASQSLNSIGMCLFEIASKVGYLSVLVEAYTKVFDENARAVRRLEELRNFMAAVWESSSDVIVYCNEQDGRITARVSPSFFKIIGTSSSSSSSTSATTTLARHSDSSIFIEVTPSTGEFSYFALNLSQVITAHDIPRIKSSLESSRTSLLLGQESEQRWTLEQQSLATLARMAVKACSQECGKEVSDMMDLAKMHPLESRQDAKEVDATVVKGWSSNALTARCETKTIRAQDGSAVLILRDISDRVHRFETEKLLVQEITKRKKDEETNSFTRHEIKNGILAAIALLDHIRDGTDPSDAASPLPRLRRERVMAPHVAEEGFSELENTLRDMLDTILDNTMTREIVYGQYVPRKELMNVPEVLMSLRRRASHRFPLHVVTKPLPLLELDRQLIRFIHRNAISNACKYGRHEGTVETILKYSSDTKTFELQVINEPGNHHDDLVALDDTAVESVFRHNTQLFPNQECSLSGVAQMKSCGNGAWIMQKCAQALGGKCSIRFETNQTVFRFVCPADAVSRSKSVDNGCNAKQQAYHRDFTLPSNTWGIAIDDSLIQRKLLDRFLKMCSIADHRRIVLGQDSTEVFGFRDTVQQLMHQHPHDYFLLIVDENLEIDDGGGHHQNVSGSLCVQTLRNQLDPTVEQRLLALIRSANDSLSDLELYRSRAHGYLHKEPISKDKVLEVVRPWWIQRFGTKSLLPRTDSTESLSLEELADPSVAASEKNSGNHDLDGSGSSSSYGPSTDDIRESFSVINALVTSADLDSLEQRWGTIREKLHILKGDLKTLEQPSNIGADAIAASTSQSQQHQMQLQQQQQQSLVSLIRPIDRLSEASHLPDRFTDQWGSIKSQVQGTLFSLT